MRRYLATGGDSAAALLTRAMVDFDQGDSARALEDYAHGARLAVTPSGRAAYRENLGLVADPRELAAFDALPDQGDSIALAVAAFWSRRDAAAARTPGERLLEHFRRYLYVMRHYRTSPRAGSVRALWLGLPRQDLPVNDQAPGLTPQEGAALLNHPAGPVARESNQVDDRGRIYLRHGPPDRVAFQAGEHDLGNAIWRYFRPEGDLIFQFTDVDFDGTTAPTTLVAVPVFWDALCALDVGFCVGQIQAENGPLPDLALRRIDNRLARDIAIGTTTDSYRLRFGDTFDPVVQLYAVADRSQGALLAVFALPGNAWRPEPRGRDSTLVYAVRLRLSARVEGNAAPFTIDTVRYFAVPAALRKGQYLQGYLELPVPPGEYAASLAISTPDNRVGTAVGLEGLAVPDPGATELDVSDMILGKAGGLAWRNPGGDVPLNPLNVFTPTGTLELFYRVTGAVAGATYTTEIQVWKGDRQRLRVSFDEAAPGIAFDARRQVDLNRLSPDHYRLVLILTDPRTGHSVRREQRLNVAR